MPIDSTAAAKIARRHGLSLQDASALARLAADDFEADQIAAMFSGKSPETEREVGPLQAEIEQKVGLRPGGLSFDQALQRAAGYRGDFEQGGDDAGE